MTPYLPSGKAFSSGTKPSHGSATRVAKQFHLQNIVLKQRRPTSSRPALTEGLQGNKDSIT
ncbi:hypothetical protein DAPPUDRAFT_276038 [Daphnia pulex]|uniref:Uncharacterized protein n=1 Tax=Daphnia pulex TaxID=6669 RepID=E9I5M8_DAPPU|nr:hypothetical protein DAPPUDRAFT_276038 [Daphnia pulex]|eukprot:EFX60702.1 hypothetical protein DAPPUDRAFT_276038 [Daphnia pulex]